MTPTLKTSPNYNSIKNADNLSLCRLLPNSRVKPKRVGFFSLLAALVIENGRTADAELPSGPSKLAAP